MEKSERDIYVHPGRRISQSGVELGHGQGMSMRDWFAGQALVELMRVTPQLARPPIEGETVAQARAREAYCQADAMMEARQ